MCILYLHDAVHEGVGLEKFIVEVNYHERISSDRSLHNHREASVALPHSRRVCALDIIAKLRRPPY